MSNKLRILLSITFMIICVFSNVRAATIGGDNIPPLNPAAKANADLVTAANQYKATVQVLIPQYEAILKAAVEALEKRKDLLAKGFIAKRDIAAGEQAVKDAQTQLGSDARTTCGIGPTDRRSEC